MFRTIISPKHLEPVNEKIKNIHKSPKHLEPVNEKIKTIHKNLCISLVYIHTAI